MKIDPVVILKDSAFFKRGQILENYKKENEGISLDGKFISNKHLVVLKENLSPADEKRIKDLIRAQLKVLFWNLYTKQSILIGNL